MPLYEYQCECGETLEVIQTIGSDAPKCPTCGGGMTKRFAPPAIIRLLDEYGHPIRSKGYEEGYSREYLKDVPPFEHKKEK